MKGSRTFDGSGIPMHKDNQTIVKERIYLDRADPSVLHNEISITDNALTTRMGVKRSYRRERDVEWNEYICSKTIGWSRSATRPTGSATTASSHRPDEASLRRT